MTTADPIRPIFTHDIFTVQRVGGVTRYVVELHKALRRRGVPSSIMCSLHICDLMSGIPSSYGIRLPSKLQVRGTTEPMQWIDRVVERAALRLFRGDRSRTVLHRTYYSNSAAELAGASVLTVHDMIHERRPDLFVDAGVATSRKQTSCKHADMIIAISEHTKRGLVERFQIDPRRIAVCHHGATTTAPNDAMLEALSSSVPFMLYVGGRDGYKNFDGLLVAYRESQAFHEGIRLVAFGGGEPSALELARLEGLGIRKHVSFARGDDAALAAHYAAARAFIYPSLEEGFGLPPLEAMLHGCPVAASLGGAIPEVVGDAAALFEPQQMDGIRSAIDLVCLGGDLRAELAVRGRARASTFTWEKAADVTLGVYERALRLARGPV